MSWRTFLVHLVAWIVLAFSQSTTGAPEFDAIAKRADEAREASRFAEAIDLYQEAVKIRPEWTEGWWYLGTMFYELDRYAEGRDEFRQVVKLTPEAGPPWALLGLCEFRAGEYDTALEHIQRGREIGLASHEQLEPVTRYHGALLLNRAGQFEYGTQLLERFAREGNDGLSIVEAFGINALRLALLPSELPPESRELVLKAGRAAYFHAARRPVEARAAVDELLQRFADAPNVHYAAGVILLAEDADKALEHFRRETAISAEHVPARLQIALEYLKRSQPEAGLPFAEEAVKLAPKLFAARNALGRLLLEKGEVSRAIQELELAVKLAPDSPETYFALARAYARAGRKEDAERARAEFLRLDKLRKK